MEPLVSILITSYNREKYIAEAIESVLSSTYQNYEIIVVDDCSTDNTVAIAKEYEKQSDKVKVYVNEKNLTQFGNRNKAAEYARGEFIKYVDSDDIIYPYTIQMMMDGMLKFPNAALGFCLTHGPCRFPLPYEISPADVYRQHFFEGGLLFVGPSGLIIKRDVFNEVERFEEFGMPSDNHLALKIASRYPIVAMTRDLFLWRIHDEQVFVQNKENHYNIWNNYAFTKDIILRYSPVSASTNSLMLKNQKKIFLKNIYRLITTKRKAGTAMKLLRLFLNGKS